MQQHLLIITNHICKNCSNTWTSQHGFQTSPGAGFSQEQTLVPITHYTFTAQPTIWAACFSCLPTLILQGAPIDFTNYGAKNSKSPFAHAAPTQPEWGRNAFREPTPNKTPHSKIPISDADLADLLDT